MTTQQQPLDSSPRGAAAALLAAAATVGLLWLVTHLEPLDAPDAPVTLTLGEDHYRLERAELEWLESFSALHFTAGEQTARELVAAEIDARLDELFAGASARLPEFADWYYSLRGEYSRLAMAALSAADLAEPDYVAKQAAAMLFPDEAWDAGLVALEATAATTLLAHQERVRTGWLAEVARRLAAQRVPPPLPGAPHGAPLELDRLVQELAAREQSALATRISLSTVAAAGAAAAGAAAARGVAATGRVAARAAGRGAARLGSAAAGGIALCAPTGPGALACALVAGTAVWLGTDWALLTLEEHLNRDELVAALESSLGALRGEVEASLRASYDELIRAQYGPMQQAIRDGFVPAHANTRVPDTR